MQTAPVAQQGQGGPQQTFHSASLYVGDLLNNVNESTLFDCFQKVGAVASIRVCRDAVTRRSLGYAYVNFHQVQDAERALDTMNFAQINNHPCRIMWSQRDPSLRKSGVGNIFIKNLHESIDNKQLYDTFSLFGNILSCKIAVDRDTGKSKGYGYVHFETAEEANAAISKLNGANIEGMEVVVGHFVRRGDRAGQLQWTNCFIKNIPLEWQEPELREKFEAFGELKSVKLEIKEGDETHKGFGFVDYVDHEAATKAVEAMHDFNLGDEKTLYCARAQLKKDRQIELANRYEANKEERRNTYQGVNIYVKNLDDSINDDQLSELFSKYGTITSAKVMTDPNGTNSKGFGFVCFSTPEEATKCIEELHGKMHLNKPLFVALAQRKSVRKQQLEAQHSQIARPMPMGHFGMPNHPMQPFMQPNMYPFQGRGAGMPNAHMPQMMVRNMPGGVRPNMPGYPRQQQAYPMPQFNNQPLPPANNQRQRGQRNQAMRGQPRPMTGYPMQPNQRVNQTKRITPNRGVANMPHMGQPEMDPSQQVQMQAQPMPVAPASGDLDASMLAQASAEQQKTMLGEKLYPLIFTAEPDRAGKITGMLLEMDNGELLHLLESPEARNLKIQEAIQVLEQHQAGEPTTDE